MKRKKYSEKIEEVIKVKIKDVEEARKRTIKYVVPAIIAFFIVLIIFALAMMSASNPR
jgi:hypothetical protein